MAANKIVRCKGKDRKIELIKCGNERFERALAQAEDPLAPNSHFANLIEKKLQRLGNPQTLSGGPDENGSSFAWHRSRS